MFHTCLIAHCCTTIGEGNGNPLQYSCLENPMDRGAWWATIHGVTKSRTRLSDFCVCVCTTLCNPMDCSPPDSSVHGIFQARILKWVVFPYFLDLPDQGIETRSSALQADSLPSEPLGKFHRLLKWMCVFSSSLEFSRLINKNSVHINWILFFDSGVVLTHPC